MHHRTVFVANFVDDHTMVVSKKSSGGEPEQDHLINLNNSVRSKMSMFNPRCQCSIQDANVPSKMPMFHPTWIEHWHCHGSIHDVNVLSKMSIFNSICQCSLCSANVQPTMSIQDVQCSIQDVSVQSKMFNVQSKMSVFNPRCQCSLQDVIFLFTMPMFNPICQCSANVQSKMSMFTPRCHFSIQYANFVRHVTE